MSCPSGQIWNGQQCIVTSCTGGRYYNTTINSCICPNGMDWNGNSCVTPTSCTGNRFWNTQTLTC